MTEQKTIWVCEKCGLTTEDKSNAKVWNEIGHRFKDTQKACGGKFVPFVYIRKDKQIERVKKSVFIEHLTEEQQKEMWKVLYG